MTIQLGRINPRIDPSINLWKNADSSNSLKNLPKGTIMRVLEDNVVGERYNTDAGPSTKWLKVEELIDNRPQQGFVRAFFVTIIMGSLKVKIETISVPKIKLVLVDQSDPSIILATLNTLDLKKIDNDHFTGNLVDTFFGKYFKYLTENESIDFLLD